MHGLGGSRVMDSFIFPTTYNEHLHFPTIMLAEKIANNIKGLKPLSKFARPFWIAKD